METTERANCSSLARASVASLLKLKNGCQTVIRHILSVLKRLRSSAYGRYSQHPIASSFGCCIIFVLALLIGLFFGVSSSEDVHPTEIIEEAAANQSGVSYSFRATVIRGPPPS
jgi:hypothetical protein